MQAMILAAGLGTRLRPLTEQLPKPLIPVSNQALIDYHLYRLSALGITEVVINVSYHANKIMAHCGDGSRYGVRICYSEEKDGPLGVAAGLQQACRNYLRDSFLLISADIWTDYAFPPSFLQTQSLAHLLLVDNPSYHPGGDFSMTESGLLSVADCCYTYANIAVLQSEWVRSVPQATDFVTLIKDAINKQQATGTYYDGKWFNVGTAEELSRLVHQLTQGESLSSD